jgi:Lipase (class 3)
MFLKGMLDMTPPSRLSLLLIRELIRQQCTAWSFKGSFRCPDDFADCLLLPTPISSSTISIQTSSQGSIRRSKSMTDLVTLRRGKNCLQGGAGYVHDLCSQSRAAASVLSAVQTAMTRYGTTRVTIVGHSLGHSFSLLFSIVQPLR